MIHQHGSVSRLCFSAMGRCCPSVYPKLCWPRSSARYASTVGLRILNPWATRMLIKCSHTCWRTFSCSAPPSHTTATGRSSDACEPIFMIMFVSQASGSLAYLMSKMGDLLTHTKVCVYLARHTSSQIIIMLVYLLPQQVFSVQDPTHKSFSERLQHLYLLWVVTVFQVFLRVWLRLRLLRVRLRFRCVILVGTVAAHSSLQHHPHCPVPQGMSARDR